MSTPQFGRKVSLIIGRDAGSAIDLSDLRIVFDIRRGDTQTPNSARVRVYNLSENTKQRIEYEYTRIVLQAGYQGNYGIIFDGTIKQVRRGRDSQTDTYLDITAADGDSAYNFAVINTTLAAGSTVSDHLAAACTAMNPYGVTQGYTPPLPTNPLPRGKVMFGMVRDFLAKTARTAQTVWSIQDGKVINIPETSYMPGDIPVITSETGMVGLPEQTQNGITIKMLLNPNVKIGALIRIDNRSVQQRERSLAVKQQAGEGFTAEGNDLQDDGYYYVMVASHSGDTRGNAFYTEVICLAADATAGVQNFTEQQVVPPADVIKPWG
ncbi:MAG: hypothetical protein CL858_13485 [Cupriavidus sp.]|jgi:hypothetical protein|nr:hypothetical protein [Cupriavidus sp.]